MGWRDIVDVHRWDEMLSPYRKALTVCFFRRCWTFYWGRGVYADYIGRGYNKRMSLGEFLRREKEDGLCSK